jgi:hypothetical protein
VLQASQRVMRQLRAADQAKRETARARNDLESYIIATREKVGLAVQPAACDNHTPAQVAQLPGVRHARQPPTCRAARRACNAWLP